MCSAPRKPPGRLRPHAGALVLLLALAPPAIAQSELHRELSTLLRDLPNGVSVGLVVEDLTDGSRCFAHEPRHPLKPASVLKLFVTAAALERFGPDFRYETQLYVRDGELWVVGAGDPGIGDERLANRRGETVTTLFDRWATALKTRGIPALEKIVLDDSIFDRTHRHPDWPADQAQFWYQAPVGGLNFNDNCVDARVRLRGTAIELTLQPPLPETFFHNGLTPGKRHRPRVTRPPDSDVFEFNGTVARSTNLPATSVRRPSVFFGHALQLALQTREIPVAGPVVRRTIQPTTLADASRVATNTTPLQDVLWRCNTFSQNLFAECLLKSLAAYNPAGQRTGQPGTWPDGARVLRATLADLGLDVNDAVFRDGSGLSHQNRVSAELVVRLLTVVRHHRHADAFLESLAVAGQSGTLNRRFGEPRLRDRIRGKSGTLAGVQTLAGYVERPDGRTLVFALLINGYVKNDLPRKVCRVLVQAHTTTP